MFQAADIFYVSKRKGRIAVLLLKHYFSVSVVKIFKKKSANKLIFSKMLLRWFYFSKGFSKILNNAG